LVERLVDRLADMSVGRVVDRLVDRLGMKPMVCVPFSMQNLARLMFPARDEVSVGLKACRNRNLINFGVNGNAVAYSLKMVLKHKP
jgi:hypothetical protein